MSDLKSVSGGVQVPSASSPTDFDDFVVPVPSTGDFLLSQDYESSVIGSIPWGSSLSYVTDADAYNSAKSVHNECNEGDPQFGVIGGIINIPTLSNGDEIWIRFRQKIDSNSIFPDTRFKFIRLKTRTSSGSHIGYNDLYINKRAGTPPFNFIFEGRQDLAWFDVGGVNDRIVYDQWETYEIYHKFGVEGNAICRVWKNGVLIQTLTTHASLVSVTNEVFSFYYYTYYQIPPVQYFQFFTDDMKISTGNPGAVDASGNPYIGMG